MGLFGRKNQDHAFAQCVKPHLDALYRLAYRLTGHREDAEDLVHDLVVKVRSGSTDLHSLDKPGIWLAKVLYRLFVDRYRRQHRSPIDSVGEITDELCGANAEFSESLASDLETQTDNDRLTTALENALNQISEEHRVLIMLYEVEGYSLGEIQSMLDLPQGTLKSRLHRARARLREILEQDGTFFESHSCDQQRFVK